MNKIETKVNIAANDILIVKCENPRDMESINYVRADIEEQLKSGLVMIPFGFSWGVLNRDSAIVELEDKRWEKR